MSNPPTKEEIREWLGAIGQDRFWFAKELGASKGTIDQMFSKGFPEWAMKSVERMMRENSTQDDDPNAVKLTIEEFERIDRARLKVGYTTRREFYRDAIIEAADRLLADDYELPANVKPMQKYGGDDPQEEKAPSQQKVAEQAPTKRGGGKNSAG